MPLITFPFFCPVCLQDADATADPVDILFGGGELTLKCESCSTVFNAVIKDDGEMVPGDTIGQE